MEEEGERGVEHVERFGVTLRSAIEASEIVADRAVGALDEVCFRFGLDMEFGDAMPLESEPVAGIGVGIDDGDVGYEFLDLVVEAHGTGDALVSDVIRNHAMRPSTISSPYDGAAPFFWA